MKMYFSSQNHSKWQVKARADSFNEPFQLFIVTGMEVKGQLQRFHKLISNDRIWPSEHGFEVIFEKSLRFQISAFKVRN